MAKWLRVIAAFGLAVLCWEVILSFVSGRSSGYLKLANLGVVARPGTIIEAREGFAVSHINSHYTRGAEFDIEDKSKQRVLVLGDSYSMAAQVSEEETFERVTESLFAGHGQSNVQVINAGQFGKGPAYYLSYGKGWADWLQPQFVVIQLNEGDFTSDFYDKGKDAYVKRSGNELSIALNPKKQSRFANLLPRLSILTRAEYIWQEHTGSGKPASAKKKTPPSSFAEEARWFMQQAKAAFPHVAVVYVPTMDYHNEETLNELPLLEVSLREAAQAEGVPYVDMRPQYAQHYHETKQPCHGFNNTHLGSGHINGYGHRLLGEALYALLNPLLKP